MFRALLLIVLSAPLVLGQATGGNAPPGQEKDAAPATQAPSRSGQPASTPPRSAGESSSRDTAIDLSPPPGEAEAYPGSAADDSGIQEMHRYDPHRADKDVEIGQFYFQRGNYKAALSRYEEALEYMPNHAPATYRSGEALEKLGRPAEARESYSRYLKILPNGPFAAECRAALERIKAPASQPPQSKPATSPPAEIHRWKR